MFGTRKFEPEAADMAVAGGLYVMRCWRGLSHEALARRLDITVRQLERYEKTSVPLPVSVLYRAAKTLDVPIVTFFAGLDGLPPESSTLYLSKQEIELLEIFRALHDEGGRAHVLNFIRTLAGYRLDGDD